MRLIDADALQKEIERKSPYAGLPMAAHICTLELLQYAPTVDAVPVVRCRDCIHYRNFSGRDMCAKNAIFLNGDEVGLHATGADDFCSYGKRRES